MKTYLVKDIDPELWKRVRLRAVADNLTVREVLQRLIERYAAGKVPLVAGEGRRAK